MSLEQKCRLTCSVDVQDVRQNDSMTFIIRATDAECKDLAKRFSIVAVQDLQAQVTVARGPRSDLFTVDGTVVAHVTQECSVTLLPVAEEVNETYSELLTTSPESLTAKGEGDENTEDRPVELIEDDRIDIGEIVAQWLALGLNPYPRSEAPAFAHIEVATDPEKSTQKPFEALQGLLKK